MIALQNATAIRAGVSTSFMGSGGVAPYVFSLKTPNAGGSIDASSGVYTAPNVLNYDPRRKTETIIITDSTPVKHLTAEATISILLPLGIICDIIAKAMGLTSNQVYFWDQKIDIPKDERLYVVVGVNHTKIFGSSNKDVDDGAGGLEEVQEISVQDSLSIDIISRGPQARDRKGELIMALNSTYARSQLELNSMRLAKIPSSFVNLSTEEGAGIPYRFNLTVAVLYSETKVSPIGSYITFDDTILVTDP